MDLYLVALHQVETGMRKQFEMPDNPAEPDRRDALPERLTLTARARLAIGRTLHRLAEAIDPATPAPSRQV